MNAAYLSCISTNHGISARASLGITRLDPGKALCRAVGGLPSSVAILNTFKIVDLGISGCVMAMHSKWLARPWLSVDPDQPMSWRQQGGIPNWVGG